MAFGGIGDRDVAGLWRMSPGCVRRVFIDQDRAAADVEPRQNRRPRQRRGAHVDSDAAHERRQPLGERVGERREAA